MYFVHVHVLCQFITAVLNETERKPSGMKPLPLVIQVLHFTGVRLCKQGCEVNELSKKFGQVLGAANVIFLISKIIF